MASPTIAIWGALLGWLLMPRIGRRRSLRTLRSLLAYVVAMSIAVAVMYYFDYHRQAWLFIIGMAGQFAVFAAVSWLQRVVVRLGKR